jgi:hypothetical protein
MFCAHGPILGGTEGVWSSFHVLRCRIRLGWHRARRVPFLCVALPDLFSPVSRAKGHIFMFCDLTLIFDGTEGAGSRFNVLRSQTRFGTYRGRWVPFASFALPDTFSCFAFPDCFSAVLRVSGQVFIFRFRTHFWRYRGCRVPFSCFALSDSFWAVPTASGPIFKFCAPGLFFGGTNGIGSRFLFFCFRTHFRLYRGCRVLFSCFALPDLFWRVPRLRRHIFTFCAIRIV